VKSTQEERRRAGGAGSRTSLAWGFAEATFFFVVPDVLFTRTTLVSLKRGWWQLGVSVVGATMAGAVMYVWADASPVQARAAVARVPFLGEKIIDPAEQHWNAGGTASLFQNPLSGVPYKVHAVLAPAHVSLGEFLLLSLPLRAERMLLSMIVFVPVALWIRRGGASREQRRRTAGFRIHAAFWMIVYAVYWSINYS
jgi:membrane protein YqaA with SNARE-associated domain